MPIDCSNPPCERVLPASTVVSVFGDVGLNVNNDCSTTLLYLTDEAGLINQADTASGAYLSVDKRQRQIGSLFELEVHFSKCSRTYYELSKFFNYQHGELIRPRTVTIGYFDSDSETMVEAVEDIYNCFTCFYGLTHVAYKKDGTTAIYDTSDQVDLGSWGTQNRTITILPTADETNLLDVTETVTNAYKSKQADDKYAVYQFLNEECINELDGDCEPTATIVKTFGAQHVVLGGVVTSVSSSADDYEFNIKMKPFGGEKIGGVSVSQLTAEQSTYFSGVVPSLGGMQDAWSHHVNLYQNISGYRVFVEGMSSTGHFIDDLIHRRYIEDRLQEELLSLLVNNKNVSMSDLSKVETSIVTTIREFVKKGVISDTPEAINVKNFEKVFSSGNGWVLLREDIKQSNLDSRITPLFTFCYVRQGSVNFISIGLCETEIGVV